jgi:hypothetical protein
MTLIAPPALSDPIWMLHDGRQAIGDPGDAAPVQTAPNAHGLAQAAILVSHRNPVRNMHRAHPNNTQEERPIGPSARPPALLDASTAQAAQQCTPPARPSQWKIRIR